MQIGADAFDCDGQVTLRAADKKHVIHVEQHVRHEPSRGHLARPAVHTLLGKMLFAEMVGIRKVIVCEPLAQIRADVQSVIARVLVDEMERQIQ